MNLATLSPVLSAFFDAELVMCGDLLRQKLLDGDQSVQTLLGCQMSNAECAASQYRNNSINIECRSNVAIERASSGYRSASKGSMMGLIFL